MKDLGKKNRKERSLLKRFSETEGSYNQVLRDVYHVLLNDSQKIKNAFYVVMVDYLRLMINLSTLLSNNALAVQNLNSTDPKLEELRMDRADALRSFFSAYVSYEESYVQFRERMRQMPEKLTALEAEVNQKLGTPNEVKLKALLSKPLRRGIVYKDLLTTVTYASSNAVLELADRARNVEEAVGKHGLKPTHDIPPMYTPEFFKRIPASIPEEESAEPNRAPSPTGSANEDMD